ncbi:unnamed protein product [Schistosoma margrebowiei]|uniref:Uncharacterized protein n=1 Tax=Schistosoma margrebowiei TaxID=48269 RepID=A0A183LAV7_9TREM|nr:unnamed protein product [Schistosoma margrebowiei]
MRTLSPVSTRIQHRQVALPREISTCTRVFIQVDSARKPWQQPYEGSFHVIALHEKTFKVDRYGRVEIVCIDRLNAGHVDDSALSDTLRFNARPIKPSGILTFSSNSTLDIFETSFSRPGQQHASSALSTDETTVSRPDQQTMPQAHEIRTRLPSHVPVADPLLRPSPFGSVNALSRYIGFEYLAYAWSRTWSLQSLLVQWFNVVSSYVCNVSGPHPYERNLQILDTNHSGSKPIQATNTAHRFWYRSPKMTFVGNSTINDRFPVRQFIRPTIARQPISPTI